MQASAALAFGIIADVQYADADDGTDRNGKVPRHYRGALDVLRRAVDYFNGFGDAQLSFVAQLGDLIDGKNAPAESDAALATTLAIIQHSTTPFVHLVGNHELYNFDRLALAAKLGTRPSGRTVEFYATQPAPGWRVLVLDGFQEAVIGWPEHDERRQRAVAFLRAKRLACGRPADADPSDWMVGLSGADRRFNPYNGGFGARQLQWVRAQLCQAAEAGERVLVLSHLVLHAEACKKATMAWDCDEALSALHSQPGVVAAVFCGHEHEGG